MSTTVDSPFVAGSPRRSRVTSFRRDDREAHNSRIDAASHLWTTVNPRYTIIKARGLYGGAPRPLSARHEFVKQAYLSDTEDWRSSAYIGTCKSHVATMDIVHPEKSTYATDAAKKHMSFSREMSLKRSVSRRVVLVKKDGALADTQYTDQYVDKGRVRAELKKQMSCVSFGGLLAADGGGSGVSAFQRSLSKSLSCAPTRGLATSLSRAASRAGSATGGAGRSTFGGGKIAGPEDRGMGRAVGHVMSSARAASMSPARPGQPASAGWIMQPSAGEDLNDELEETPRMEDL